MCYIKRTHFVLLSLPNNYKRQIWTTVCWWVLRTERGSFTNVKVEVLENVPSSPQFTSRTTLSTPHFSVSFSLAVARASQLSCLLSVLWSQESKCSNWFLVASSSHYSVWPKCAPIPIAPYLIPVMNSTLCPYSRGNYLLFKRQVCVEYELLCICMVTLNNANNMFS